MSIDKLFSNDRCGSLELLSLRKQSFLRPISSESKNLNKVWFSVGCSCSGHQCVLLYIWKGPHTSPQYWCFSVSHNPSYDLLLIWYWLSYLILKCLCNYQLAFVTLTLNAECQKSPRFAVPSYLKPFFGYLTGRNEDQWDLFWNTQIQRTPQITMAFVPNSTVHFTSLQSEHRGAFVFVLAYLGREGNKENNK